MTTYFQYNPDGSVTGYRIRPVPSQAFHYTNADSTRVYNPAVYSTDPLAVSGSSPSPFMACSIGISRSMYPEYFSGDVQGHEDFSVSSDPEKASRCPLESNSGSSTHMEIPKQRSGAFNATSLAMTVGQSRLQHPNPDDSRRYSTVHQMLYWIDPHRLHNALFGPKLDIVEMETGVVFSRGVPKKALILFCGRSAISRFLRTVERQNNENWTGPPVIQQLNLPKSAANYVGVTLMVEWMLRACEWENMGKSKPIRVPENLFAAISLARTLQLFGLYQDANRVDTIISGYHFNRPISLDNIMSIWQCVPRDSKYVYRMVERVHEDLKDHGAEPASGRASIGPKALLEYLKQQSELEARIRCPELNARYRLEFCTKWCRNLNLDTQVNEAEIQELKSGPGKSSEQITGSSGSPEPLPVLQRVTASPKAGIKSEDQTNTGLDDKVIETTRCDIW